MKKFLIGLVTGVLLTGLSLLIFTFSLARLGDRKPSVVDNSTLLLKVEGEVPERAPTEIPLPFFESKTPITTLEYYDLLRRAATDPHIKAVVLMPQGVAASWGKLQELRDSLLVFKKSGKPLLAYLRTPGSHEYYLATAADKIYCTHEDQLNLKGLRLKSLFFKNTLDKLGVQVEVEHAGKYKDAGDLFTRTNLSPESKEVLNSVLDGIYGTLVSSIAEGRHQTPDDVRRKLDNGPFQAQEALQNGFVDGLLYEDEMYGEVKKRLNQSKLEKLSVRDYVRSLTPATGGKTIAVVTGDGAITRGSDTDSPQGENGITAYGFAKLVRRVAADDSVNAVILRIDSPGGDAIASDDLLREIKLLSQKKPMVVSMSDVAASGGYYMAVTGDPIVAYPNTLTGSIGVIFGKPNIKGLYDKIGITQDLLQRGTNADLDDEAAPLSDRARAKLRTSIDATYQAFLSRVAEGRRKKVSDIQPLAQGRVWLGSQAKQVGLVDELGGFDKAVELVKAKAKMGANEKVRLVAYPPKRSVVDQLLSRSTETNTFAGLPKVLRSIDAQLWLEPGLKTYLPPLEVK